MGQAPELCTPGQVRDATPAMEAALDPCREAGPRGVRGQSMCKFIHRRDEVQLRLAARHVAEVSGSREERGAGPVWK